MNIVYQIQELEKKLSQRKEILADIVIQIKKETYLSGLYLERWTYFLYMGVYFKEFDFWNDVKFKQGEKYINMQWIKQPYLNVHKDSVFQCKIFKKENILQSINLGDLWMWSIKNNETLLGWVEFEKQLTINKAFNIFSAMSNSYKSNIEYEIINYEALGINDIIILKQ